MTHLFLPNNAYGSGTFAKYHGNGNDFILFDSFTKAHRPSQQWLMSNAPRLCNRSTGIGADGIIILDQKADYFHMVVINADGSVAENCGNGLRCAALHIFKSFNKMSAHIELARKSYFCQKTDDAISVEMGDCQVTELKEMFFTSCSQLVRMSSVLLGNKHMVLFFNQPVDCFDAILLELHAKMIVETDVNIGFVFAKDSAHFFSIVYERGVGFTKSCGSGACAAASFLAFLCPDKIKHETTILQPGGELRILINKKAIANEGTIYSLSLTGHAEEVFTGICEVIENC